MKIAINFAVFGQSNNKEELIAYINELQKENNIYICVENDKEGREYNIITRKSAIEILEENNIKYTDVISCSSKDIKKIQNILNVGAIIENSSTPIVGLNDNIKVYSFRNSNERYEDGRTYCDTVEELKIHFEDLILTSKKKLLEYKENDKGKPSLDKRWMATYSIDQKNATIPKMNVYDYVYYNNYNNMDALAIRYFGNQFTFNDIFNIKVNEFAKSLKKNGIGEKDVVTIMMPNTPEGVIAFFAINKIGAVACMMHPLLKSEDMLDTLSKTNSKYMIMCDMCYPEVSKIENKTNLEKIIVVSPARSMPVIKGITPGIKILYLAKEKFKDIKKGFTKFKLKISRNFIPKKYVQLISKTDNEIEKISLKLQKIPYGEKYFKWDDEIKFGADYKGTIESVYRPNEIAVLLRTGGTSGNAKLAALTNENITSNTSQLRDTIPSYAKGDELLAISPIFHGFGLVDSVITALAVNMSVDLHPQYNKPIFIKSILKNKPVLILGVPTLWKSLINDKRFDGKDLSFAKVWISGGDTLVNELKKLIDEWRMNHRAENPIFSGLGMTEATAAIAFTGLESTVSGSVGFPLPLNDIKIINPETGEELGYEEPGELCVSGPTIMKEYFNNSEETKKSLVIEDGKVWLHTGDICMLHKNGEISYQDRNNNIIIVSGVNVYSNKIEEVINQIPEVENCAVVASPHPYKMNVPVAYVVLRKGIILDDNIKEKIIKICAEKLDTYSKVSDVEQIDTLPLTALNKVNKKKLREMAKEKYMQKTYHR